MSRSSEMQGWRSHRQGGRILWAITANDLRAALKNKNVVVIILTALVMVLFYRFYPGLAGGLETPRLLVYAEGQNGLVPLLEESQALKVYAYPSEEGLMRALANTDVPVIGLVLPAGFDQEMGAAQPVQLQGYVMHWMSSAEASEQEGLVETEIALLLGRPVEVQTEGNHVYPRPDSHGLSTTLGFSLVYVILMTALPMIPHLFLEEKKARTMDALLVSPASAGQIVAGKAFSGLFYCLAGAVIALVVYWNVIVHLWLAVLAIACGSLFTVALGLWLGMRVEDRGQMSMTLWIVLIPLLIPVFLFLMAELFPAIVVQVLRIVPTTVLFNLFRMAAAGNIPWAGALLSLAWVLVWAILFLALVIRQVRRLDRQYEGKIAQTRHLPADQPEAHGRKAPAGRSEEVDESLDTSLPGYVAADGLNAGARIIPDATGNVPQSWWKIIRAIAAKDIRHAIRSKVIAAILLGVAFTGGFNSFLPMLLRARSQPAFAIYNEGRSSILRGLGEREDFRLSSYASREEMEGAVSGSAGLLVGLVIPPDFDQRASGGAVVLLDGYISHTADLQKARQWASFLEEQLRQAGQGPVQIRLDGNLLYPSADSLGQAGIIALLLAIVIFTIGVALVPLLFIEEKETHTLEALLVSPAGLAQVVAGKALAGATYGLIAGLALMGLNQRLFTHWGVALLALLLATFFTISIGLLLGLLCNNPTTVGTWGSLLLLALLGLTALAFVDIPGLPLILRQALSWLPGATMLRLFRASMAKEAPLGLLWANAAALFAAAALIFSLAYWQIKRIAR